MQAKKHRNGKKHPMDGTPRHVARRHIIPVIRIINPLDPRDHVREELTWGRAKTIADYFPVASPMIVSINGKIVPPEHFGQTYLEKGDNIVLCPIPAGGDGDGKMVLRLIAFIALVVITQGYGAQFAGAMGVTSAGGVAVVQAGMMMAGSMLINAALPPPKPTAASSDSSSSYGIDGAKNTSLEGIPVPVCYGRFRTGGNIVGLYTENNGDDNQTLYMLINAGEGPVISLSDIYVNDQPVTDYKDVEVQTRLGEVNQVPIPWFTNAISPQNKSQKLTLDWSYHTTTGEVDAVRFDLTAPALCWIKKKDGSTQRHSVPLEFEFRKVGETEFKPMQLTSSEVFDWRKATTTKGSGMQLPFGIGADPTKDIPEGGTAWMIDQTVLRVRQQTTEALGGPGYIEQADFAWTYENGEPVTDTAQVEYLRGIQPDSDLSAWVPIFSAGTATMSGQKKGTVRRSYRSPRLPEARYEFRYRRTTPLSTDDTIIDVIYMADVNEVTVEPVTYTNTALVALKIRLTDQLSGVPTVTFMNGGRIVRVYNESTKAWDIGPSHNPAWAVWDMLTHTRYGGGVPVSRLDFEAFREWAKHCDEKGLTWNGPIDTESNVWDAAQLILRVGHAQLVNIGTRFSVIIERAAAPVMMFSVANMVEGSYKESWLPTTDRANEVDVTYYDKEEKYASRTIKVVDPGAIAAGAPQRASAITLQGVVDRETAFKEGQFALNLNRYILKTVSFTAPLEAIACTVGDLVYVQHDMTDWAQAGRFDAGSTTTSMKLDRDITMAAGKTYRLLMMRDSIQRFSGSITSIVGTSVFLSGFDDASKTVKRIKVGTKDLRVAGTFDSGSGYGVIVDDATGLAAGQTYQLWDTDVIEEYGVVNVPGTTATVTLQSPAPVAPAQFTNWMFGETEKVKKPFRIRSIGGTSEYTREITALEYKAEVYDFARYGSATAIDPNAVMAISAVRELIIYEETYVRGGAVESNVVASWAAPLWGLYAGADLYIKINDGPETMTSVKSRTAASIPAARGDTVTVRAIAFDVHGTRAPSDSAPSFTFKVVGEVPNIDVGSVSGVQYAWSGRECKIDWRYNAVTRSYEFGSEPVGADAGALDPHFKDYEVKVYAANGTTLRRTEYVTDSAYTYTYDKNFADGITRRVVFKIRMRDIFNNLGAETVVDANNPAPIITSTTAATSFDQANIAITHDNSADFTGMRVYMGTTGASLDGVMPPDARLVYDGPDTSVVLPGLMFDTTYYYRVVAVDGFGLTELVPTATLNFKTKNLDVAAIADGVLADSKLLPALKTRIDLIDADKSIVGSVNARIEAIKAEFAAPDMTGYATAASVASLNDVTATSDSANARTLAALKAQVNDAVTGLPIASAAITALNDVSATSTSAAAKAIYQLTSRLDNVGEVTFEQAFNTQANAINGLSGQYSVKIDSNGYIAGFGLSSETSVAGENTSEFVIMADKFGVIMPSHAGVKPFTIGQVGGVPRVILSNALIGDASINSAMIGSAQITSLKLAGEAVTVPVVVGSPDRQRRGPNEGNWVTVNTGYMPMEQDGLLYVLVTAGQGFHNNSRYWAFRIKVNGAVVRFVMGRVANDTPVCSASVPVAAGTAKVDVEWSAHYDVQLGYTELFMMGVKR
jgi:predicted phage tail protein